jgi:hypothetical protein
MAAKVAAALSSATVRLEQGGAERWAKMREARPVAALGALL